jgi:two-component system, sensor histidine kinase and response regulator
MAQPLKLQGIRTLIVDDDPGVRSILHRTLTEWGGEVVEAEGGPQGIVELKRARDARKPFELIFVDSTMYPIDGFEIVERIRVHPEEFARTILMVGPEKITEEVPRARKLGLAAYIAKPLSRPALVGGIASVLSLETATPPAAEGTNSRARFRILLAEDSPEVSWIIRRFLEGPDYQVDLVRDGGVAVDLFRITNYDLVLMDIQMPNFDGYWATREIRTWERENHLKPTPIVALTAFPREEDPQKSLRAGLDGYLVKPVTKEALRKVLEKHLGA